MEDIKQNLQKVREHIARAAQKSHRSPEEITLVAVSKTIPVARLQQAVCSGISDLGENRVQEALPKIDSVNGGVRWHLIGHLQRNKVKYVVGRFHLIHSVDSLRLAEALDKEGRKQGVTVPVLIQVNVSGEESKYGISPKEVPVLIQQLSDLESLQVRGLMTIAPLADNPEASRPFFCRLRELAQSCRRPDLPLPHLSMGMSGDYQVAIEEGATIVRVGKAIFGDR